MSTIEEIRKNNFILLDCISGSQAYGLNTKNSDIDKRGIYYLSRESFFSNADPLQISNGTGDESYTELGKFFELLAKNNPTMIEMMNTPKDSILYQHPLLNEITPDIYLSKLCLDTFAGYAVAQIKKAKGLKKKINVTMSEERKTILDFCYIPINQGSVPLTEYLALHDLKMEYCGLSKIPHMHDLFALFYDESGSYKGIMQNEKANEVCLSSIPKGALPITYLSFNKSGYSQYCREYKEYWSWVKNRNESRYQTTLSHGKSYDAKNMMHTFRLLYMSLEIATEGCVNVKRNDRDRLLQIKMGEFEYEDLIKRAEELLAEVKEAYLASNLPKQPDKNRLKQLLVQFREELYIPVKSKN